MQNELEVKIVSSVTEANKKLDQLISKLNGVSKSTKNTINDAGKIGKAFNLGATYIGAKKLFNMMNKMAKESIDYSESLNLFNVVFKNVEKNGVQTFSTLGKEATQFQNKLNEAFGTNQSESLNYHAIFQSMAESMNITEEYAGIMSENSTKLVYDISSLFNDNEKNVGEALRAGIYAGQTKPLRKYGYDITQQTLQPILDQFEIKNSDGTSKTVKQLSQAEKQILRYIAVLQQSKDAQGDWANTIESPSNQLKIMNNQLKETSRALGNLFVGAYAKMLPYVNAILMVVKEVANAIADMFGIKISDYNSGIASSEDLSDSYDDVADSVGGATQAVKELKRETLSFDQIHNINENKDNGSGGGSSISGGIDQRLLDAIKGYDNGMDKVRMKATQIRDKIMEWLGFTKEIDPITGKVSFKYQGMKKTLKNIWESFKGLNSQGKLLVGLGLVAGAIKLWNIGKKLFGIFGDNGLLKVIKSFINPISSLFNWMKLGVKVNGDFTSGIRDGVEAWRVQNGIINKTTKKLDGFKGVMNASKLAIQGMITSVTGMTVLYESMKNLSTEGANLANVLGTVGGTLATIAGGAQIGSIFGSWGTAIGAVVGALGALISGSQGYQNESEKFVSAIEKEYEATKKVTNSLKEQKQAIKDNLNADLTQTEYHKTLLSELDDIVEGNGKVKKGYEERAKFIVETLSKAYDIEIKYEDGIIKKYQEKTTELKKVIKQKQAEMILDANKEYYVQLIQQEADLYKKQNDAVSKHKKIKEDLKKSEEAYTAMLIYETSQRRAGNELTTKEEVLLKELENRVKTLTEAEKVASKNKSEATKNWQNNVAERTRISNLEEAVVTGDLEKINEAIRNNTNVYETEEGKKAETMSESLRRLQETAKQELKTIKEKNGKITESDKTRAYASYNELVKSLQEQTKAVKDGQYSKELIEAWGTLGENNKDKFLEVFGTLDEGIQQEVVNKMENKGYSISFELQKGMKKLNPKITFKADKTDVDKAIGDMISKITNITSKSFNIMFGKKADGGIYSNGRWHNIAQYANGGLPPTGQMFIAREKGPELVGKIGSSTAVMNNAQIVESVKAGVYQAVSSAMSQYGGSNVSLDIRTEEGIIVKKAINGINKIKQTTGECPIDVW